MKIIEYLDTSMFGSHYIPCEVIGEDSDGFVLIRYTDLGSGEVVEMYVDRELLRIKNADITPKIIKNMATETAMMFKRDLLVVDKEQLSDIAQRVEDALMLHFGFPD